MRPSLPLLALLALSSALLAPAAQAAPATLTFPAPDGPGAAFCDGNRAISAMQCISNIADAAPLIGPIAGIATQILANQYALACRAITGGDASSLCRTVDAAFERYAHERLDTVIGTGYRVANCVIKYGTPMCPTEVG